MGFYGFGPTITSSSHWICLSITLCTGRTELFGGTGFILSVRCVYLPRHLSLPLYTIARPSWRVKTPIICTHIMGAAQAWLLLSSPFNTSSVPTSLHERISSINCCRHAFPPHSIYSAKPVKHRRLIEFLLGTARGFKSEEFALLLRCFYLLLYNLRWQMRRLCYMGGVSDRNIWKVLGAGVGSGPSPLGRGGGVPSDLV